MIEHCFREVEPEIRVVGIIDLDENGVRTQLTDCEVRMH